MSDYPRLGFTFRCDLVCGSDLINKYKICDNRWKLYIFKNGAVVWRWFKELYIIFNCCILSAGCTIPTKCRGNTVYWSRRYIWQRWPQTLTVSIQSRSSLHVMITTRFWPVVSSTPMSLFPPCFCLSSFSTSLFLSSERAFDSQRSEVIRFISCQRSFVLLAVLYVWSWSKYIEIHNSRVLRC